MAAPAPSHPRFAPWSRCGSGEAEWIAKAAAGGALLLLTAAACWLRARRRLGVYPNFDKVLDRRGRWTEKHDFMGAMFGAPDGAIALWVADSDLPICPRVHQAIRERASHPSFGYTYQPLEMWRAVAAWYKSRHGWDVDPASFVFTTGVVTGLAFRVRAFSSPGDGVLVMTPLFAPLPKLVEAEGRRLVQHRLHVGPRTPGKLSSPGVAYHVDFEALEAQVRAEDVRVLILCNPHNPGGRVWSEDELQHLLLICERYGVLVISDEIHADWCLFGHEHAPLASLAASTEVEVATLGGPGETFAIPGLQSAFLVLETPELRRRYLAVAEHTHNTEGGVFATEATIAAYRFGGRWLDLVKAYVEGNILEVERFLERQLPAINVWRPMATFLVWLDCGGLGLGSCELQDLLVKAGLVLTPGGQFGAEAASFQRLNVACSRRVLRNALRRLEAAVRAHGKGRLAR